MDEMRAHLDSLLGADRNALPEQRQNRQQRFNDSDVCRYFLIDFCPHDLFPNTRSDLGPCPKIHNESLKEQYQNSPEKETFAVEYEAEFISFLERLIEQAEQKIEKANRRIDAPLPDNALLSEEQQQQVDKLNEEISRLLGEAEKAGERGDVEEAAVITRQVQQLRREADRAASSLYGSYMQREKSLRVCPICGAMQSVGDSMSRFESHVTGKQHQGFEKIRSCLEELKRRRAERQKQRTATEGAEGRGRYASGYSSESYRQGGVGNEGYRHGGDGYRHSRGNNDYQQHRSRPPRFQPDDMDRNRRAKRPRWSEGDTWAAGEDDERQRRGTGRDFYRHRRDAEAAARSPSPMNRSGGHSGRRGAYGDDSAEGHPRAGPPSGSYSRYNNGGSSIDSASNSRRRSDYNERGNSGSLPMAGQRLMGGRGSGRVVRSAAAAQLDSSGVNRSARPSDDGEPEEGEYFVGQATADKEGAADRSTADSEHSSRK